MKNLAMALMYTALMAGANPAVADNSHLLGLRARQSDGHLRPADHRLD